MPPRSASNAPSGSPPVIIEVVNSKTPVFGRPVQQSDSDTSSKPKSLARNGDLHGGDHLSATSSIPPELFSVSRQLGAPPGMLAVESSWLREVSQAYGSTSIVDALHGPNASHLSSNSGALRYLAACNSICVEDMSVNRTIQLRVFCPFSDDQVMSTTRASSSSSSPSPVSGRNLFRFVDSMASSSGSSSDFSSQIGNRFLFSLNGSNLSIFDTMSRQNKPVVIISRSIVFCKRQLRIQSTGAELPACLADDIFGGQSAVLPPCDIAVKKLYKSRKEARAEGLYSKTVYEIFKGSAAIGQIIKTLASPTSPYVYKLEFPADLPIHEKLYLIASTMLLGKIDRSDVQGFALMMTIVLTLCLALLII